LPNGENSRIASAPIENQADRPAGAAFFLNPMPDSTTSSRAATAAKIAANPTAYKVCEGCNSIVGSGTSLCPNCHGYHFDPTSERVVYQARLLGNREQTSVTADDLN
jgi:hypothetical protein